MYGVGSKAVRYSVTGRSESDEDEPPVTFGFWSAFRSIGNGCSSRAPAPASFGESGNAARSDEHDWGAMDAVASRRSRCRSPTPLARRSVAPGAGELGIRGGSDAAGVRPVLQVSPGVHVEAKGESMNSKADLALTNGRVFTRPGVGNGSVAVRDGRIVAVGTDENPRPSIDTCRCGRKAILPAVIDPHVHLRRGAFSYRISAIESARPAAGGVATVIQCRRRPSSFLPTFPTEPRAAERCQRVATWLHFILDGMGPVGKVPHYHTAWRRPQRQVLPWRPRAEEPVTATTEIMALSGEPRPSPLSHWTVPNTNRRVSYGYPRYFSQLRNVALFLLLAAAILVPPSSARSPGSSPMPEPIAFVGHGAMFDQDGNEITPTATFIREAQDYYMDQLLELPGEDQRRRFEEFTVKLTQGQLREGQALLVVNSRLIDWLIREVGPRRGRRPAREK